MNAGFFRGEIEEPGNNRLFSYHPMLISTMVLIQLRFFCIRLSTVFCFNIIASDAYDLVYFMFDTVIQFLFF